MYRTHPERGSALLIITILIIILSGIAGAFLVTTWMQHQATMETEDEVISRQAASAGIDKARRLLYEIRASGTTWSTALSTSLSSFVASGFKAGSQYTTGGTTIAYTTYDMGVCTGSTQPESTTTNVAPDAFFCINYAHGGVVYNAIVADDNDGDGDPVTDKNDQVVVFVTVAAPAQLRAGQARRILGVYRAIVYYLPPQFVPNYAIIVGGNLKMAGSPSITGLMGSVHANGDLAIQGGTNIVISQQGSASGGVILTGTPGAPAQGWKSNAAPVPLPRIDPNEHKSKATVILASDGKVYDNATGTPILIANEAWCGFTWSSSKGWTKSGGDTPPPGAIYIDGSVSITGGGSSTNPWVTTLLVNGTIEMSGNPKLSPFLTGVTMMAKGDIKMRGNSSAAPDINGLIATHEQIDIAGTPSFRGSVIAEDAEDLFSDVTTGSSTGFEGAAEDFMTINGNFSLAYDGNLATFLTAGGTSVKLREWDRYR